MKCAIQVVSLCLVLFISSCKKNDPPPEEPEDPIVNSQNADTLSNHLKFMKAQKKTGSLPQGPAGSTLKFSVKDTLFLSGEYKRPIKFLHEDPTKNVAGIYVQVRGHFQGGTNATYYYDVPELNETANNDTVSTILVDFDPEDLIGVPPAGSPTLDFTIVITPYLPGGAAIATDSVPVKITSTKVDPNAIFGSCSIITAPGDYWDWELSYIEDPNNPDTLAFFNSPDKLWGLGGQMIRGSCCNGQSVYGLCSGEDEPNQQLLFPTFFNYNEELFKFIGGGTFVRYTGTLHVTPDPQASNFCGTAMGVVREKYETVTYNGNWTINKLPTPIDGDSLTLTLQGTGSVPQGGGYGNPGGRIRILDCFLMVLIQGSGEGGGRDLVKFYNYRDVNSPLWVPFG